jgi:hypothetical protein
MLTNTNRQGEALDINKMLEAIKSLPKMEEFWSYLYAPIDGGWKFEDDKSIVTICHPTVWAKARQAAPEHFAPNGIYGHFGVKIIEIDDDSELSKECRKRFTDVIAKAISNPPASKEG